MWYVCITGGIWLSTLGFCNPRPGISPLPCHSADMVKCLMVANDKNLKDINTECSGNLELQTLVMATIEEYKQGVFMKKTVAGGAEPHAGPGLMTAELVRRRSAKGKRATPGADEAADAGAGGAQPSTDESFINGPGFTIAADQKDFKNAQKLYKHWSVTVFLHLFRFCEPSVFTPAQRKIDSKNVCRIMFTRGVGLECGAVDESESDKSTTTNYAECFEALRQLYICNGRIFRLLVIVNGTVSMNDPVLAMYDLRVVTGRARAESPDGGEELQVVDTVSLKAVNVPSPYLSGRTSQEFLAMKIRFPFSRAKASLITGDAEEPLISDLFPREVRCLRRQFSNRLGATKKLAPLPLLKSPSGSAAHNCPPTSPIDNTGASSAQPSVAPAAQPAPGAPAAGSVAPPATTKIVAAKVAAAALAAAEVAAAAMSPPPPPSPPATTGATLTAAKKAP